MVRKLKNKLPVASNTDMTAPVEAKQSAESKERERRYKAEDAMRDLERAEGHKRDKQLMADVKNLAKEKIKNLDKIC